jgi:hypothetical protein
MGTLIWLAITTIAGCFIGLHWYPEVPTAELIGAGVGLVVGVLIRIGSAESLGDFGDSFSGFDGGSGGD